MNEAMNVVKKAVWRDTRNAAAGEQLLFLVRHGKGDYRWVKAIDQKELDGVAYLDEGSAIRAMRLFVDHDPSMVGIDLTIGDIAPSPEVRAAKQIDSVFNAGVTGEEYRHVVAEIIARETNINGLTTAVSELLAYIFRCRVSFAAAVCPTMPGKVPRDLTMDGLLLAALEAMSKATGQDFSNLIRILKEPVGQILAVHGKPKGEQVQ
jgi:hypothetical protein